MEESEKRRERLRALRMEAAQANASNNAETSLPNHLSNPLIETSATMLEQSEPCIAPRFDFYTDPMSAFSASKKRGKIVNQTVSDNYVPSYYNRSPTTCVSSNLPGLRNPGMILSPAHQFHGHSPDQRMVNARGFSGSGGHGSPTTTERPFLMDQGTPGICSGLRSPFVNNFPGHLPRGVSSPGIVSGPRGSTHTNAMQDWINYRSPSPSSGYRGSPSPGQGGHGRSGNMTPSSRWGSGQGLGSHGRHFSSDRSPRPEQFYDKSMLEDPWKFLQPVIWRINAPSSNSADPSESRIPKSLGTKKARVSESSSRLSSQTSLAEYLAASFNEAVNDAPSM